jgi:CubicO group peptidase (beta-lactamase class C family)
VPGLAVTIVAGDSVLLARGYGVRRLGRDVAVDEHTMFGLMSTTKTFTATALALLVSDGRLSWDDPVARHLPSFRVADPDDTHALTIRDLLSHRTGYQEEPLLWRSPGMTRQALIEHLAGRPRQAPRGTTYLYSNLQYLVAADVVEAVSGLAWEEFLERRLFAPLGMEQSTATHRPVPGRANVASAHTRRRTGLRWSLQPIERIDPDILAPAGAIFSNAHEMSAWLRLHLNRGSFGGVALVAPGNIAEMQQPHVPIPSENDPDDADNVFCQVVDCDSIAYGLGWIVQQYRGQRALVHSGGLDGQNAFVGLLPDAGIGVAVLVNRDGTDLAPALILRAFDMYLGVEPLDWSRELRRRFRD